MSVCLLTIADKEEYADIQQVRTCGGCPYFTVGEATAHLCRIVDRCGYYNKQVTLDDAKYAFEHGGKPEWCTLDHVIAVHKPKGAI